MNVNIIKKCTLNRWSGRYLGPGIFRFAVPAAEHVSVFTDHSVITFLKDGTACESVLLDKPIIDAGKEPAEPTCNL